MRVINVAYKIKQEPIYSLHYMKFHHQRKVALRYNRKMDLFVGLFHPKILTTRKDQRPILSTEDAPEV